MTSHKTIEWMWAQANDLLDQAERMQRQMFHLSDPRQEWVTWQPPVNVFENEHELIVIVALPGVPQDQVEVHAEPGELLVRARCPFPFSKDQKAVCRLEIPYGRFERRITIPAVRPDTLKSELRDGYLILQFEKFVQT